MTHKLIVTDPVNNADLRTTHGDDDVSEVFADLLESMIIELGYESLAAFLSEPDCWINIQAHKAGDSWAATRTISLGD